VVDSWFFFFVTRKRFQVLDILHYYLVSYILQVRRIFLKYVPECSTLSGFANEGISNLTQRSHKKIQRSNHNSSSPPLSRSFIKCQSRGPDYANRAPSVDRHGSSFSCPRNGLVAPHSLQVPLSELVVDFFSVVQQSASRV